MVLSNFTERTGGALTRVAGGIARLGFVPARLAVRVCHWRAYGKAFAFAALAVPFAAFAAAPPNTAITNTATASYSLGGTPGSVSSSVTVTTVARTPSAIDLLQYVPADSPTASVTTHVNAAQCSNSGSTSGPFANLPAPVPLGTSTPLALPGDYALATTPYFHGGEAVFVSLTDLDQNIDANAIDTVVVTVRTANGDSETLRLAETGPSTGVFVGAIQTTFAPAVPNDCRLSVALNSQLTASYTDPGDSTDTSAHGALVDPYGIVFDSSSGAAVNGATVALIDAATGGPARILCDDGVTAHPSSVISGAPSTACGSTITLPAGGYRFPLAASGSYRLQITPPTGYAFPSTVANAKLQALPGAPFVVVTGSRGEAFLLNPGPAVQIDVPLDPAAGNLEIVKTSLKAVAAIGDLVPYALAIRNPSTVAAVSAARIVDQLPTGFRYRRGSARLDGAAMADPEVGADGRTLTFAIGTLRAGGTVTLRYVADVTAGAKTGQAENIAQALAPITSNVARALVLVREDLLRSRAIIVGRVTVGECRNDQPDDQPGLPNARIVMEDGRYALTDSDGRWHFDDVRPGTHVVQLDVDSLPPGYEVQKCQDNTRFAGRAFSQFVNVRGGSMWRADFVVRRTAGAAPLPVAAGSAAPNPAAAGASSVAAAPSKVSSTPAPKTRQLVEQLPYDDAWLATAAPGIEWLHPHSGFNPAIPAIKVAVKHQPDQTLELTLNGAKVSALNFEGTQQNTGQTVALSMWRGVALRDGANELALTVKDAAGQVVSQQQRTIHYASAPSRAAMDGAKSRLVADGKSRPVIAVRFTDSDGRPVRAGLSGEFQINEPYLAADTVQAIEREPLAGRLGGRPRFEVDADGTALIELMPTTKTGEAVLTFTLEHGRRHEIRAWLEPAPRDWILVGFAQGTAGHRTLSGNMEALKAVDADGQLFDENRIAFYAKGQIKGEYLLTLAYDSAKERGTLDSNPLKQAIDPNRFYTLYGDASDTQYDAASIRKLYVRIERAQFYAMFGDYDTGLTVTEMSRYSRTLNGLKSEYRGEQFGYNAFATTTSQGFVRDDLRGDGTSGRYRLTRRNILVNSDKVRIEVRDRFRNEVIVSSRALVRFLDYDIDYALGTLFFREPIPSRDEFFNPVYIVVEYESADPGDEKATYGGRAAWRPTQAVELGATYVHEGNVGADGNLAGVDVTFRPDESTTIKGEYASSDRLQSGIDLSGQAWKVEAIREDQALAARLYARQQDEGFGLGQQANSEAGTRRFGGDARYRVSENVRLDAQAYRQQVLITDAERDLAEGLVEWRNADLTTQAGMRWVHDRNAAGLETESRQAVGGVAYELLDRRLRLRARGEYSLVGEAQSVDFPNRLLLGADYKLTALTTAFAEQEFARGENLSANMTRVGMKTAPWAGAEIIGSVGNELVNDGTRLFSGLGLTQKWQIDQHWQADFLIDRTQTLKVDILPPDVRVPLASGSLAGDHTAVAVGLGYADGPWSANSRVEWRTSDEDDKLNVLIGAQRQLSSGRSVAAGFLYSTTETALLRNRKFDGRASYALRPDGGRWFVLDRFDVIEESLQAGAGELRTRKFINNLNANYMPSAQTQWSFQYGAKYVIDRIDGSEYTGYTDLVGVEVRRDIGRRFDVGASASVLHSWHNDVNDHSAGVSVGYRLLDNTWIAVGYNLHGFRDRDFAGAEYRVRGVYFSIRAKFDQDTLGLDRSGGARP